MLGKTIRGINYGLRYNLSQPQPLLTLFLTVALGYLVGEIDIKGFSLGSGAVLFVGLFIGWLAPDAAPRRLWEP